VYSVLHTQRSALQPKWSITGLAVKVWVGGDKRPTLQNSLVAGDPDLARSSEVFYYSSPEFLTVWQGQPSPLLAA